MNPSLAMHTASTQISAPAPSRSRALGRVRLSDTGSVSFEGIAVIGGIVRILGLVLLLILAILPG
jgi:hypothetical protein